MGLALERMAVGQLDEAEDALATKEEFEMRRLRGELEDAREELEGVERK